MADDDFQISTLARRLRQKLADGSLTIATVKEYADAALAKMMAGSEIISITMDGGSSSAVLTCNPAVILEACNQIIEEEDAEDVSSGVTHLNLARNRIET